MQNNSIKDKIVETLHEHPEGLTILKIAEYVGVHRHTVTKYIYELIGGNKIRVREIAAAKVCFLVDDGNRTVEGGVLA